MTSKTHDTPTRATAEEGVVFLDGPNGVAIALTLEAAEESARAMLLAVEDARRQRDRGDGEA